MAVSLEAETKVGMSFGPGMFSDDDFHRVAHEVVEPLLDDFEEFVESHGTKFYRKYKEVILNNQLCAMFLWSLCEHALQKYNNSL